MAYTVDEDDYQETDQRRRARHTATVFPEGTQPCSGFNPEHICTFDLETTGTDPLCARIVTSAAVNISGSSTQEYTWLANPGIPIPPGATQIHGITTEHAQEFGLVHDDVVQKTVSRIRQSWAEGRALIVFNAPYDLTILAQHMPSFTIDGLVIDPLVIDRALDPYRKGQRTLTAMAAHYGVSLKAAHDAGADALAAAQLAHVLAERFPRLTSLDAVSLMEQQRKWHQARQESFANYLRRKGKDASDVTIEWPLITTRKTSAP